MKSITPPEGWRDVIASYAKLPKNKHEHESRLAGWRDGWKACADALAEDFEIIEKRSPVGDHTLMAAARRLRSTFRHPEANQTDTLLDAITAVNKAIDVLEATIRSPLTKLDAEVLQLTARGHTNAEIARAMKRTDSGIRHIQNRIRDKLNSRNLTAAVAVALAKGWIFL